MKAITRFDLTVNQFAVRVDNLFSKSPLLNRDFPYLLRFQSRHSIVSAENDTASLFKDTLTSETHVQGVSLGGGRGLNSDVIFYHYLSRDSMIQQKYGKWHCDSCRCHQLPALPRV
jgi:hypothetical protein